MAEVVSGGDRVQIAEDIRPGASHLPQRPEPLGRIPVQRFPEEFHQAVAEDGVEDVLGELYLFGGVKQPGPDEGIAPGRHLPAGHLVQGDRHRVEFGRLVVAGAAALSQERVEVVVRADVDFGVRRASQGEVEEHQLAALTFQLAQGQVVRLDVAVPDVAAVKELHGLEQVLAQPLKLVDGQRAVLTDLVGQGVVTDILDRDQGALRVRRASLEWRVDQPGDMGIGELPKLRRLAGQPGRRGIVERHLEDAQLLAPLDQQRTRRGALAEHPLDGPPLDLVALACRERVDRRLAIRRG